MPTLAKPRALQSGDHIRVISPASALNPDQVADGIRFLEDEGYRVSLGKHVFDRHFYLAGVDQDRADDLMEAIEDESVHAIMCSRGGYGCARIAPLIDFQAIADSGKPICGFSDVTTLHLGINARGLQTWHTPMLLTLSVPREPWVYDSLRRILRGENPLVEEAPPAETLVPGTAEGTLTGGCLCLLTDSFGTDYELDCRGKIVIIEDVDEMAHRVDAMLTHLVNNGQLGSAAGIVIGEMTGTDESSDPKIGTWPWREIVADRIRPLRIPSVIHFPFGHMRNMLSLPLGARARLNADAGRLQLVESP